MVNEFSEFLFATLSRLLQGGTVVERTAASYCRDLLDEGRFEGIRKQTKFEELIEIVERASNRSTTDELMALAFRCRESETGFNHRAISHLLKTNSARGCITTNFDNAIELGLDDPLAYEKSVFPSTPSRFSVKPFLHKIHGDVQTGIYINTNTLMLDAYRKNAHDGVRDLLNNAVLLSVGYSGNGDIDILPMLETSGALLTACIAPGPPPAPGPIPVDRAPKWWEWEWECDLRQRSGTENFLIALATHFGWTDHSAVGTDHEWHSQVAEWCAQLSSNQRLNIVRSIFSTKNEDPVLHLHLVDDWNKGQARAENHANDAATARVLINNALYNSGLKILRALDGGISGDDAVRQMRGFALWRKGHFAKALKELRRFTQGTDGNPQEVEGLKTYLETLQEYVSFMPKKRWSGLQADLDLSVISERLEENLGVHSGAYFLTRFALARVRWTISSPLDADSVTSELTYHYKNFRNLQMYSEAAMVARTAAELSLASAQDMLSISCKDLRNEAASLTVKRNLYILILINKLHLSPKISYWLVEGIHRRWAQSLAYEIFYRLKRRRWYADYLTLSSSIHDKNHEI